MSRVFMVVLIALCLTGCGGVRPTPTPVAGASMRGHISDVGPPPGASSAGVLRVEGAKVDPVIQRASVTVPSTTPILRQEGNELVDVGYEGLQFGQLVEITFAGPLKESDPVQGTAARILIVASMPQQ